MTQIAQIRKAVRRGRRFAQMRRIFIKKYKLRLIHVVESAVKKFVFFAGCETDGWLREELAMTWVGRGRCGWALGV